MPDTIVTDAARLWGAPLQAAGCPRCGQAFLAPPDRLAADCPNCFESKLSPQPARLHNAPPELMLSFAVSRTQAAAALEQWASAVWLRPDGLNGPALAARLTPTFLPMWLVDGSVAGAWQAQAGYDYQVASSQEAYHRGKWTTHKVTETRVRWEPRAGQINRFYQNVTAPALEEQSKLNSTLGSFPITEAEPYNPNALRGAVARAPNLLPEAAWPIARGQFDHRAAADCMAAAAAQHIDRFALRADYGDRNWTQLLLPVYATAYTDEDGRINPVFMHGRSGKITGRIRVSLRKAWQWAAIIAAFALACFVVGGLIALAGALFAPLILVGGALLLIGLASAVAAPLPVVHAWRINKP